MRCNDCRESKPTPRVSVRDDVCDDCWKRRLDSLRAFDAGTITPEEMYTISSAMNGETELPASVLMDAAMGKVYGDFTI